MSLEWIDLFEPEKGRTSSLGISDREPNRLCVTGGLSHAALITLKTADDAQRLRAWLDRNFPQEPVAQVNNVLGFPIIEWTSKDYPVGTKLYLSPADTKGTS